MTDGVIKYSIVHQRGASPLFPGYQELESLRSRLYALGLIGVKDGIGYGNISSRLHNEKSFFITATQTGDMPSLPREYYSYVRDYDFENFTVFSEGVHRPSSEALSHAMVYKTDERIKAVIHIHSLPLWEFMIERGDLFTEAAYGTTGMAEEIAELYEGIDPLSHGSFVMKGHEEGVMLFGKTVEEAEMILFHIIRDYLQSLL